MARSTNPDLQKQIIYSVYIRNHTKEGSFSALIPDLPRIRSLGTDIVWLMPIHPIGIKNRKGTLGSPYANMDYRSVNPEYGTLDDFIALADAVHENGMKLIIDVVYNHTSPDSVLWNTHPEFFYKKADGNPGNRVGDWTDIIDLDYGNKDLWEYQIESLKYWAQFVDGFRCDVASLVPLEFWKAAREAVEEVRPGCIWLAESVDMFFNDTLRINGMYACRDADLYEAFDMEYDYDLWESFTKYLRGEGALSAWISLLNLQDFAYPSNYNKLRFLENHDRPRIASQITDAAALESFTCMLYFLKGATMIYGGQEKSCSHLPALFDKDDIDWESGPDISALLVKLAQIKKKYLATDDLFYAVSDDGSNTAFMVRRNAEAIKIGIFPLSRKNAEMRLELPAGEYLDLISGEKQYLDNNLLVSDGNPKILVKNL